MHIEDCDKKNHYGPLIRVFCSGFGFEGQRTTSMGKCLKRLTRIPLPLNGQALNLGPNFRSNDIISFLRKKSKRHKDDPQTACQKHEEAET